MRVLLFGKNSVEIQPLVERLGFSAQGGPASGWEIVDKDPEIVFAYGGDGALIKAEHKFPGVPKVLLKGSVVCKRCPPFPNEEILRRLKEEKIRIEEVVALEARSQSETKRGINDIIVHNKDPRRAIRYQLWINDKELGHEVIGDGIVVATPYGSTGYYRSITASFFDLGIGLAFNNSTERFDHMVLRDECKIKVKIVRGPAEVYADNQKENIELGDGDEVLIQKSKEVARLVVFS